MLRLLLDTLQRAACVEEDGGEERGGGGGAVLQQTLEMCFQLHPGLCRGRGVYQGCVRLRTKSGITGLDEA